MQGRVQRDVLSQKVCQIRNDRCAPPSYNYQKAIMYRNERASLCTWRKGNLTIEASLIMPFFLMIMLAFFSFFSQYASAAELKVKAAAEAKKVGIVLGCEERENSGDITIYKSQKKVEFWNNPFWKRPVITEKAVCRAWIGFTELGDVETYVYITPQGSVYHLYRDCTHLELSIRGVSMELAKRVKNDYGQKYRECELCDEEFGGFVYITSEGDCYHSERNCSGLKRTIRQVALTSVSGRAVCERCIAREE